MGALSKGCGTCKRRKVKCDETHPKCTRCCNAGIECTGFIPRLRYVDEKPSIQRRAAVSQLQFHDFSTIIGPCHLALHSTPTRRSRPLSPAPFLANMLPLTAFKDDIFISYLVYKLFGGEHRYSLNAAGQSRCGLPIEWISELINTPQKPRPKSWDALATIVYGQAHRSYDVITNAVKLYGQALPELRSQLSNPNNRRTDSTLGSMTALYMYEMLVSKTEKGWMLHADGLGALLQWRGPWLQKSYARKSIFLEHRITLVAKAIMSSQSTFLRSPIWKKVPWEDDVASKSAMDYLVDIGADIAEYLAQIKNYDSSKTNQELKYTQLRTQVANSIEELNTWWWQWEVEHAQSATEVPLYQVTSEPLFTTRLEYDMLWTAYTVCIYDVIRILLLQLWFMLQLFPSFIASTDPGVVLDIPNRTALLGVTSDTKGLAYEILRSLKYCYGMSRRFTYTFSFLFIQEVAYGCFDQDSNEANWIAAHGWAELVDFDDIEDANLLKRNLPLGHIKLETLIKHKW